MLLARVSNVCLEPAAAYLSKGGEEGRRRKVALLWSVWLWPSGSGCGCCCSSGLALKPRGGCRVTQAHTRMHGRLKCWSRERMLGRVTKGHEGSQRVTEGQRGL